MCLASYQTPHADYNYVLTFFLEVLLLVKHLPTWNPDSFVRLHHDGLWSLSAAKLVDTVQDGSSLKLLQFILRHTKFLDLLDRIWSRLASKLLLSFVMAVKWKTCRYHVQVLGPDISIQINLLDSSTHRNHPGICIYHTPICGMYKERNQRSRGN